LKLFTNLLFSPIFNLFIRLFALFMDVFFFMIKTSQTYQILA